LDNEFNECRREINIKKKDYGTGIPRHEIEALARCLLPEIQRYFESEDGKREFEEWKRQQKEQKKAEGNIK
jgi:hypothetical protein